MTNTTRTRHTTRTTRSTRISSALIAAGAMIVAADAAAQSSVTLYGAVDDAVVYANNQKGSSNVYLRQGNLAASKWGLSGNEDLGGGLAAIFDVQAGFDPNTGAASSAGLIFNRQAYVGLRSNVFGTMTMGRQYTPYLLFVGPLASSWALTGATGAHPGDIDGLDTTIRINNAVTYTSPIYAGLQASAMYALGGFAGSTSKGQTISAALRYANGPIGLAAAYLQMDNANTNTTPGFDSASTASFGTSALNAGYVSARSVRHAAAAGTYTFGKLMVGLNYTNVRYLPGDHSIFSDTAVFNTYGAIATYRFTPAIDVAGGFSYTLASHANGIDSAARYQQYSLKEAYHLSKRTTLYAIQAFQRSNGNTLDANGNIVMAAPSVGDAENATPSSTRNQFVGMLGMAVLF
ncbi:putative porin [Paraburkholderia caballeronis]|uniref:Outer membrane protein (Porin) n=2 Tax=Paraburkholderia caballeronis TaxID=416943 RepID=A0A1H7SGB5_9BURK|nr:putative porin [Paraburkholderia caballeronis]PXW95941.1 putative porin [Paraburkholderia caballeronis]RAJ92307.1 putative porin [Paraburkholderia caballeronis]TDV08127.1 putative porin [Paraburkholderia caballeronis]TDV11809.1 putative porin [Paraburkholderia caballeronis]